jgi:hypothetical protein
MAAEITSRATLDEQLFDHQGNAPAAPAISGNQPFPSAEWQAGASVMPGAGPWAIGTDASSVGWTSTRDLR